MTLKLDSALPPRLNLDLLRQPPAVDAPLPVTQPPAVQPATAHEERITLSDDGREASRGQGLPPRSEVRWYRAAMIRGQGHLASSQGDADAEVKAAAAPQSTLRVNAPRTAIDAYVETMQDAA